MIYRLPSSGSGRLPPDFANPWVYVPAIHQFTLGPCEARQLLEEHRIGICEAQLEAAGLREEARERGARIISEAREQALTDARRIVDDAAGRIQEARANYLTELHPQVAEIAMKLSERILGEPPYEHS